jgi:hypothetical protein
MMMIFFYVFFLVSWQLPLLGFIFSEVKLKYMMSWKCLTTKIHLGVIKLLNYNY